jgi:hypothetical protein
MTSSLGEIMWYPIDGGDLPDAPVEGGNNVPVSIKSGDAPAATELADWIQTEKDLSMAETLSLGFAPFSLDETGDHRTIVLDAMRYVDKDRIRWGVGVRFTLHAWSETGSIKGSVALVAAQASLNLAYTRATFQVLGYNSPDLVKSLPGFEEMSVSNYADLMTSLDTCRSIVLEADPASLRPTAVAVSLPVPPPPGKPHHWGFHLFHQ